MTFVPVTSAAFDVMGTFGITYCENFSLPQTAAISVISEFLACPVDYRSKYMKGLFSFENSAGSGVGLVIGGGISTAVPRVSSLSSAI